MPACEIVNGRPAIIGTPVREDTLGLDCTTMRTVPVPRMIENHGATFVTFHGQSGADAVTVTSIVPPLAGSDALPGLRPNVQGTPA